MNLSVLAQNFWYCMVGQWPNGELGGVALTVILSVFAGLLSAVIGLLLGLVLACSPRWIRGILIPILGFFRAVPIVMLIFCIYYVTPLVLGLSVPAHSTVVISLGCVGGAYLAYSVAAGINSVPRGQWRAGTALGLSWLSVMLHIILPQALPRMLPSFVNQWVSLIKDTSLGFIISTADLTFIGRQLSSSGVASPAVVYLCVALLYFIGCTLLDVAATIFRKKLSRETV